MSIDSINKWLPDILTEKKYKVLRHIILLLIPLIIALSTKLNGEYKSEYFPYYESIIFFILFTGVIYLNMYVLVPKLLLLNKLPSYFASLLVCVLVILLLIGSLQFAFHNVNNNFNDNYARLLFNPFNACIVFGIIITCSTTFIIFRNWIIYKKRISDLESTTLDIELQQLKNQINPHFLFNMLNNANIMVKEDPLVGSQMIKELDKLLCYQTDDSTKEEVLLSDDISFVTSYLDLEKTRRNRFEYTIYTEGDIENTKIPPLLFIPFVENTAKHSQERKSQTFINLSFRVADRYLEFSCINSKPKESIKQKDGGLGLKNIQRRLHLIYDSNYTLDVHETETTYSVNLKIKI